MIKRGDCAELLRAADSARALGDLPLAADLASGCSQEKLAALADASTPAQALLWCGRAAAAGQKGCDGQRVAELASKLHPRVTIGPPDESMQCDPLLLDALAQTGADLNLSWEPKSPDVIVGKIDVSIDHSTFNTVATAPDAKGGHQRVPAVQHRFIAKVEAQVELGGKTRVLRASEEARDTTWEAAPRLAVAAKFNPSVPSAEELKKRGVAAWVRALAKALAASPPEAVDVSDEKGCVAYGLSLNLTSGDSAAAAAGRGDVARIAACEKLLGEPPGGGIPVP